MGNFRNGLRKATAQQFFNELQEKLAASTAQVFAERAQGKSLSPGEISNFVDAAKAMGFERPAAESMAKGLGTPDQYNDFVRRSSSFTTGGNIQPAEASRFANNRIVSSLFRFQSYPQMKLNAFRKAYENMADAVESGDGARIKSSSEQLAKFLFGTAALGVSAKFLAALLTGRDGGVAGVAEDAEDGPGRFILDSVAGGMGGPVSALNYAVGSGNMLDTLDPRKLNAGITFPGSIYLELQQMFRLQGPYKGMTIGEAVGHYLKTKVPAGRVIRNALLATGVVTEPDQNTRETYRMANKFREKSTDPKIKAEFERSQKEHFEPSDYIALRVALQNDDLDRAKAEYQNLLKIKKHKDIMEAMNPKTQDGDWKPITGMSRKNELAFLITLSPKERSVFDAARQERMKTYRKFKESLAAP
jgi:hypothetical protein